MIRAIIFDCFGVLVGRGFSETYRMAGGDPDKDADFIEDMLGQANLGHISPAIFQKQVADKLGISSKDFQAAVARAEQPNQELLDYIAQLHKDYKTAILSNANRGTLTNLFSEAVLNTLFDAMIVSAEVGMIKPDPGIYKLAAEKLGVDLAACVFIDDQERYCTGAGAVGMQTIIYKDFAQFQTDLEQLLAK